MRRRCSKEPSVSALRLIPVLGIIFLVSGCVTPGETAGDGRLEMESEVRGYVLGERFSPGVPEERGFAYRGTQGGHRVYHIEVEAGRWGFSDMLLHIDAQELVNKIVLLRQFETAEAADRFYDRRYTAQKETYRLAADSGNRGGLRYARVEAYPTEEQWERAYERHRRGNGEASFNYYYHPRIARRTASFAVVRGIPTVTLIYEGHRFAAAGSEEAP